MLYFYSKIGNLGYEFVVYAKNTEGVSVMLLKFMIREKENSFMEVSSQAMQVEEFEMLTKHCPLSLSIYIYIYIYMVIFMENFVGKIMLRFINLISFKKEFMKNEIAKAS